MPATRPAPPRPHPLATAARLVMLALVAVLAIITTRDVSQLRWIALLAVAGIPALAAPRHPLLAPLGRAAEVIVLCLAASQVAAVSEIDGIEGSGLGGSAVLPYLAVPLTCAALRRRTREAVALVVLAGVTLAVGGLLTQVGSGRQIADPLYLTVCIQWLILASLGIVAATTWQRIVQARGEGRPQPYAEASRLLTQLRSVARQLPGATLDPGGISEHLLEELRTVARADRAAVLSASGGGRLVVLAQVGIDRVDWETTLDADSAIADAWASQQPQTANRSQARSHPGGDVSALVVPLVAGVRTIGLLALEADAAGVYPPPVVNRVTGLTGPAALRLEAALLFDEVRSLATNE
ncbi:MAG TPA: GAF domain-containing protein, partial [Micromonosporaceae bacterium]|nr:GAF domain-containing protein [Micromonosporaceae bacterium]